MKSLFVGTAFWLSASTLWAQDPHCYRVSLPNLAESGPEVSLSQDRWCYWSQDDQTLIFAADDVRAERAALVRWSSDHKPLEIAHGSLAHGETTLHRSRLVAVNPLPVPLDEADLSASGATPDRTPLPEATFIAAGSLRATFQSTRARAYDPVIAEGTFNVQLEEAQQPFAGYWWPQIGAPLASGARSPLGKYDAVVGNWTHKNPDSVGWEKQHHASNTNWAGHCNGWAASAILYPDFKKLLWDKETKLVLLSSDIKGMLAEASFCVDTAFYGHRYDGHPGDDLKDIYPPLFHQTLLYYLTELKKPLAFDHESNEPVDNNVISGYTMTIEKISTDGHFFRVSVQLHSHDYEHFRNEQSGAATVKPYNYQYTLQTDADGKIIGGDWESDNPDFLWAPVAQKVCGGENPRVDPAQIEKMMQTLPEAKRVSAKIDFKLDRRLRAQETVQIPIKMQPGTGFEITVHGNNFQNPVKILATGTPLYPTDGRDMVQMEEALDGNADQQVYFPLSDVRFLLIYNDSRLPSLGNHIEIEKAEFWAGD